MHGSGERIRVLHVDDEPEFADVAATFLEREDDRIAVRTATSASEGLDSLADRDVDCIVSDYDMPGTNGIEFLERVREDYPDLPFVLFTGKGSEEIASEAVSAGVSDYLQKETGTDQYAVLANRIANLVSQRRAQADLETRVRQQEVVAALGREALAGADLEDLFETAVEQVAGALDNEYAKVLDYRPERGDLLLRAGVGWDEGLVGEATVSDGSGSQAGYTLQSAEPVVVEHLPTEDRFRGPALLTDHDVESGISVIVGDVDDPWGVLGTHSTERKRFTEHDVTFVRSVATVLATAIERTERERELAETNALLSTLFDTLPHGVLAENERREVVNVNERMFDLFEMPGSPDAVLGADCERLAREVSDAFADPSAFVERIDELVAAREPVDDEDLALADGRTFERSYRPIELPDGNGHLWVYRDVTERRRRERELSRNKRAMDEAPVGITITDPDRADNPIIYANGRFRDLTGYSESEVLGRNCRFLQGEGTDPEPVAAMRAAVDAAERVAVELRNYRADGTEFWNRVTISPVTDDEGRVTNFVGFQEDVTERKEREREREATIEFLQRLYDVATDPDLTTDEKITRLLQVGPEKLDLPYGHLTRIETEEGSPGGGTQTVIEASGDHDLLQPGQSCPLSRSYCRKTIGTDGLFEVQNALASGWADDPAYETFDLGCYIGTTVTVDDDLYGTVFFASGTPREEPFSDAERTFVRLTSKLVSYELERERTTEKLQQHNERLDEFTSVVSHDLRNPLTVAQGGVELAREECDSDHLERVQRAHERMETLIDDLLALARQGDTALEVTDVDLASHVETCWRNVETGEASLVVDVDRTVRADESRLRQLFENLFRNSVEHGGPGVTVTVSGLADGFAVEDDGPGIPADEREEVFEPGYTTSDRGTGFGLTIVRRVAESHGWTVHVTEGADGGARFEVTGVETATDEA